MVLIPVGRRYLARVRAGSDPKLAALLEGVQLEQARGDVVGGPGCLADRVLRYSTDVYWFTMGGGEPAIVYVSGDGDTDLDLYVYDENGNLIGADTDSTDECVVEWWPRWTGPFRIEVRNLGHVRNTYTLCTN